MLIENANSMKVELLIRALDDTGDWRKVAEQFGLSMCLEKPTARCLIKTLNNRQVSIEELSITLSDLNLHQAASLIAEPETVRITKQPYCEETGDCFMRDEVIYVQLGGQLRLKIDAVGSPLPSYEWFCDNSRQSESQSGELLITNFSQEAEGLYHCAVSQQLLIPGRRTRVISEDVTVKLANRLHPTKKFALIIGNSQDNLVTPLNDACMMDQCLSEKYNFECKVLTNCSAEIMKREIRNYFQSLPEGAFVLFYFGGHGFTANELKYMVGFGVDRSAMRNHVICEDFVLVEAQKYKPILIMSILDMCQTTFRGTFGEENSGTRWECPMVRCYSTSRNREALEESGSTNSVYTKHLLDVLRTDKDFCFLQMIGEVTKRIENETPLQVPETTITGNCMHFKLSDPVIY